MKKTLSTLAILTASVLSVTTANAAPGDNNGNTPNAVISLVEPTTETGTDWGFDYSGFTLDANNLVLGAEYAKVAGTIDGKLPGDESNNGQGTTHWGLLMEPSPNGDVVSDILKLTVINPQNASPGSTASFTFEMWSDGADAFDEAAAILKANSDVPRISETGEAQDVGGGLLFNDHSGKFVINVTSDVEEDNAGGPEGTVPDGGATMLLLGGGVSALALLRRKLS